MSSELEKLRRKLGLDEERVRNSTSQTNSRTTSNLSQLRQNLGLDGERIKNSTSQANSFKFGSDDIAPVSSKVTSRMTTSRGQVAAKRSASSEKEKEKEDKEKEKWYQGWFDKGALKDGYQAGDISKVILGASADSAEDILTGVLGSGEKFVDWLAGLAPYALKANDPAVAPFMSQSLRDEQEEAFKQAIKESDKFIAKDLYDENAVAKQILATAYGNSQNLNKLQSGQMLTETDLAMGQKNTMYAKRYIDEQMELDSVLGEKSDALMQSAGALATQAGLQVVGVPWWITSGTTSMGAEMENALRQGATHEEALISGAVSGGAEVLTEKMFGGDIFTKNGADLATKYLSREVSNKIVRNLIKAGYDVAGEGFEEALSQAISRLGSSVYKDEKLKDILFSEEAWDEYIESAIGGIALGGAMTGINVAQSNAAGVDYTTGLTENEQKVVDKVYKDEVSKAEKNGKVTEKQKDKIYDKVLADMEKGYISTDTIEEVLGGESYTSYKNTVDSEDAILREFEELGQKQNATLAEQSRYSDLSQQVKDIKSKSSRDQLKSQLGEEVFSLVKGDRLVESYNERARRGQTFEADLSKYDTKQQQTVQNAINSGTLNNSNRTHELVDFIAKISADKGVLFDFTNNEKIKGTQFAVEGKIVNGYVTDSGITLNVESPKYLESTVGHEITHVLEGTEFYDALKTTIFDYAKSKGEYDTRLKNLTELYKNVKDADVEAELTADLVGDYIFADKDFVNKLSTENRNVFQKIYDEIKYLCKVATAGSKEARELEKVRKVFEDAYREGTKKQSGTQYSMSEEYSDMIDSDGEVLTISQKNYFEKNGLKDDNGNLIKLYRSADGGRTVWNGRGAGSNAQGIYLTDDVYVARAFASDGKQVGDVLEVYANAQNPLVIDAEGSNYMDIPMPENAPDWLESSGDWEGRLNADKLPITAFANGHDAVIIKNVREGVGGEPATDVILRDSNQMKRTDNKNPSADPDIRYSLSEDSEGRKLSDSQSKYFNGSKVTDEAGNLKVVYHGSPKDFNTFSLKYLGTNGTAEGYGFYFTDKKHIAEGYSRGYEGQQNGEPGKLFECYLDIKKPLSDTKVTMTRAQFKKFLTALNKQVDADGEPLDILSNYGDVEWEGLNKVLSYAMEIEYDGSDSDVNLVHSIINGCGNMEVVVDVLRKTIGYDGIIVNEASWGGDQTIYIAFHPEQIKNIDNLNPTTDPDIRRSLSNVDDTPYGNRGTLGKDVALAPVAENATQQQEIQPTEENATVTPAEMAEMFPDETSTQAELDNLTQQLEEQYGKITEAINAADTEALTQATIEYEAIENRIKELENEISETDSARMNSLDDSDVPPEIDAPYYGESEEATVDNPFAKRDIKEVGSRSVKAYQYENPEVKPFFQDAAYGMLGDLRDTIKGEKWYDEQLHYATGGEKGWFGTKRQTTADIAELKDTYGYTYDQIEKGLNAIIEDNGKENNAVSKRIEFMLNDRLMEGYTGVDGRPYPPNQEYLNLLYEKNINEYSKEAFDRFMETADQYAPEDIAPVKPLAKATLDTDPAPVYQSKGRNAVVGQTTMFEPPKPNQSVAAVRTKASEKAAEKSGFGMKAVSKVVDKGMVFENLSLDTGNMEVQAKWNSALPSNTEAKAQYFMEHGTDGVKPLKSIVQEVTKSGKEKDFFEYMYHAHNVDRMSLEERFHVPNKSVYGETVTADKSRWEVKQFEAKNPEFKEWAKEVYSINKHLREMLVSDGIISRETANLWEKMYPHYVPITRVDSKGLNVTVPLDTNKTGVNAPIKRATGGNSDIEPLFNTMAQRIQQTYRAIARNSFGIELKNTLGTTINSQQNAAGVDEMIDTIEAQEDHLLKPGTMKTNPTFTVFENGERVEFEITEDMFEAMKPADGLLGHRIEALSKANNIRRNLLTNWNPIFAWYRNPVKDLQDVAINSQHAIQTYASMPKAIKELATNGKWAREYHENGGKSNTYFDSSKNEFVEENGAKKLLHKYEAAGEFIEEIPRLAEYIASRVNGRGIERSMLDAARVTTNFAAGGDFTKFLNSHGFTFLNASIQGASQHVRNFRESYKTEGTMGAVKTLAKYVIAGIPTIVLNGMLWDDDEDYEELSDYVKQNYYVLWKTDGGKFVRIPKGRTAAVMGELSQQMVNLATGDDEVDFSTFFELFMNNIAPNNPLENNILAPIGQTLTNKAWYGGDLVPSRLQKLPAEEQYDESTDILSQKIGEATGTSPYKWNYLIDQYSGGLGDVFLPMMTPEAESGDNTLIGNVLAPWKKELTTDKTLNNKNPGNFYDLKGELEIKSNSSKATEEDSMRSMYMDSVSWEMSDLYKQKREVQNSNLPDSRKYEKVREIQEQINALAENALNNYNHVSIDGLYSEAGDKRYNKDAESGKWYEIKPKNADGSDNWYYQKEQEVTKALGISYGEYWNKREEYNYAYDKPDQYAVSQAAGGYESYRKYTGELWEIKADKDKNGKTINGSRKEKVIDYLNNLDADYYTKIILFKNEYNADDTYNYEIIDYLNSREDISYSEMEMILKHLGFEVDSDGNISW